MSFFSTATIFAARVPRVFREQSSRSGAARWIFSALLLPCLAATNSYAQTASCKVTYTKAWEGGTGFGANIDITNTGPAITNGWTLLVSFPNGQTLQNGWPVAFSQTGAQMTVASNAQWNQSIASGATFSVGFNGSWSGSGSAERGAHSESHESCCQPDVCLRRSGAAGGYGKRFGRCSGTR